MTTRSNRQRLQKTPRAALGVDVEILYAENDSIKQSQQILKFVQAEAKSRSDGIILEPVGGTGLPQVARAAVIAWVVLNRELDYVRQLRQSFKVPVFGVTSDNLEIGRIQAQQLAALLPKREARSCTFRALRKPTRPSCASKACKKLSRRQL